MRVPSRPLRRGFCERGQRRILSAAHAHRYDEGISTVPHPDLSIMPKRPVTRSDRDPGSATRIQKILADSGLGSRRACEQLIVDGRVEVDRKLITELGARADPHRQEIRVDGQVIRPKRRVCYLVNKPKGFVCTNRDPERRPRVIDLVPDGEQLFTVGRLDMASEGLILVTNDGELANQLAHPRYGVPKTYRVHVEGVPTKEELDQLRRGVHLAEGFAKVENIRIRSKRRNGATLEMVLREGKNREVRRVLARIGHKVLELRRIALGPLRLEDVPPGAYRELTRTEIKQLTETRSQRR